MLGSQEQRIVVVDHDEDFVSSLRLGLHGADGVLERVKAALGIGAQDHADCGN
jgi:hypothetical protein